MKDGKVVDGLYWPSFEASVSVLLPDLLKEDLEYDFKVELVRSEFVFDDIVFSASLHLLPNSAVEPSSVGINLD